MGDPEKPWYTPMILAFLREDCPRLLGQSQQLFARDIATLERRLAAEGESFLTKTLPALGKAIDLALQKRQPLVCTSFKKRGKTALPAFLSGLLRRVFSDDGWVRDIPCVESIRLLRQICFWCKKLQKGYSDEALQRAITDFIQVDEALPLCQSDLHSAGRLLAVARVVVERILRHVGDPSAALPCHGPGAVAGGDTLVGKRQPRISYRDLEAVFRPIPWMFSLRDASESPERVYDRPHEKYGLSRTTFVEKDSSGPRTIGLEPSTYMWCQQALKGLLYHHVQHGRCIAKGHINFDDQTKNRELARDWRRYDTLDMSKASDRNSLALFQALFAKTRLYPWLLASRTPGTVLPNGTILHYRKFAPMGSAVCFPVQAITYYALTCAALHLSGMPLILACRQTYVYGDDLIVPHGHFAVLEQAFESVGLKFNADKCCTSGKFRESCGLDAYDGIEVTPVRFRKSDVDDEVDLMKLVEHTHSLAEARYWGASYALFSAAKRKYRRLRAMRLPHCRKGVLPILTWPEFAGTTQLKSRHCDGVEYVCGWVFEPDRLVVPEALEMFYLRESLSLGAPVGIETRTSPVQAWGPEPVHFGRCITAKYRGRLAKLWRRRGSGIQTTELQKSIRANLARCPTMRRYAA